MWREVVVEVSGQRSVTRRRLVLLFGGWCWGDFLFFLSSQFSHWSLTGVDGLAEFACDFGEFGFAGSGEEIAACCAEEEAVEGHAEIG